MRAHGYSWTKAGAVSNAAQVVRGRDEEGSGVGGITTKRKSPRTLAAVTLSLGDGNMYMTASLSLVLDSFLLAHAYAVCRRGRMLQISCCVCIDQCAAHRP
jgi:hypothetical protein